MEQQRQRDGFFSAPDPACGACRLPERAVLRMTGDETWVFLQGLLSNDVLAATATRAVYALLLTPQGRWRHDMTLLTQGPDLLLETDAGSAPALLDALERYRLRAQISLNDESDRWEVWAAWGGDVAGPFGLTPEPGCMCEVQGSLVWVDARHAGLGVRLLCPAGAPPSGLPPGSPDTYNALRLALGVPEAGRDLVSGQSMPLEFRLDELNAISWTKGCYVGQEITARTHHRHLTRRRIVPVILDGPCPPFGTPITSHSSPDPVGEILSGDSTRALALLPTETAGQSQTLSAGGTRLWIMAV